MTFRCCIDRSVESDGRHAALSAVHAYMSRMLSCIPISVLELQVLSCSPQCRPATLELNSTCSLENHLIITACGSCFLVAGKLAASSVLTPFHTCCRVWRWNGADREKTFLNSIFPPDPMNPLTLHSNRPQLIQCSLHMSECPPSP